MTSLLFASFVAGVLTVLVPCILPLLPVVVGGSITSSDGKKHNPYIIIGSLLVSIIIFTLVIQGISNYIYIPSETWNIVAAVLVFFVGITFLIPGLWHKIPFVSRFSISSNKAVSVGIKKQGITGDIILGAVLAPLFSSCSPTYLLILATILPASFFEGVVYLISFVLGLGTVLLLIALLGQVFVEKLYYIADERGIIRKVLGIIMILVAFAVFFGWDKDFAVFLLDNNFFNVTKFELEV